MSYYRLLNLTMEPFSNSPDPEFFFRSRQHMDCLQKLELAIRLRRGLSVVLGEVGTGKTTLCRQLIRMLAPDDRIDVHLVLDPHFVSSMELLWSLARMLGLAGDIAPGSSEWTIKGMIQERLLEKGVEEGKITLLIIDEGQKIPDFCLEILRELLNFEVNEYKLLQIVIFAQKELEQTLARYPNVADRVSLYHVLGPLPFGEMRDMIRFRLEKAAGGGDAPSLLSSLGWLAMYRATAGYPRQIVHLCHRVLLALIVKSRREAGWLLVRHCAATTFNGRRKKRRGRAPGRGGRLVGPPPGPAPTGKSFTGVSHGRSSIRTGDAGDEWRDEGTGVLPEDTAARSAAIAQVRPAALHREDPFISGETPASSSVARGDSIEGASTMLGRLTVTDSGDLEQKIAIVYGTVTRAHLEAVRKVNGHIADWGGLRAGDRIAFPAHVALRSPLPPGGWWIQVAQLDELRSAYAVMIGNKAQEMPLRLLAYRTPRGELKFSIIVKFCYIDEETALAALGELSPDAWNGSRVLSGWEDGTVFLTLNPEPASRAVPSLGE